MTNDDDHSDASARPSDPFSSHAAAAAMRNSRLEQMVFDLLKARGVWMTALEIAEALGMHPWSISPRLRPLWRKGKIEEGKKLSLNTAGKPRLMVAWRAK